MDFTQYDAVLFDLDGVLTPTADIHQIAWRQVFEEALPLLRPGATYGQKDYIRYIDGRPRYEGVAAELAAHDIELPMGNRDDPPGFDTVCAIGNRKNDAFRAVLQSEPLKPYAGSMRFLDTVDAAGLVSAVVSSSRNATEVLHSAGITDRFRTIVDGRVIAEKGLKGKPDPEPFTHAAAQLGVTPARAIVIEDAVSGVKSGHDGHFGLVIAIDREDQADALKAAGADIIVTDLADLIS